LHIVTTDSLTRLIALDWGTSSARAYRIGATGEVLERREAPLGLLQSDPADSVLLCSSCWATGGASIPRSPAA
jgi:2-keto-3-deoxy-galactonokinase